MLKTVELAAGYGETPVLRDVSLEVNTGEVVAVLGPNGAGKTTLLRAISSLIPVSNGSVVIDGGTMNGMGAHAVARSGVAHVLDSRGVLGSLTVRENILLGIATQRPGKQALNASLDTALHAFPWLKPKLNDSGNTLSGGQQQMVALARAMVMRPRLLLLDEPSQGLAPIVVEEVFRRVAELAEPGRAILIVEQFIHKALAISDRAYVLQRGRIVAAGASSTINEGGRVEKLYFA